jgi:hypothetical protein
MKKKLEEEFMLFILLWRKTSHIPLEIKTLYFLKFQGKDLFIIIMGKEFSCHGFLRKVSEPFCWSFGDCIMS